MEEEDSLFNTGLRRVRDVLRRAWPPSWTAKPPDPSRRVRFRPRFGFDDGETHKATFPSNRIVTSKYTMLNFLPKNLFEQFSRAANFYFLFAVALMLIPGLSPFNPISSILALVFIISVSAVKQAYEDYFRHQADEEVNQRLTHVLCADGHLRDFATEDVVVGDIVQVHDGEEFPCDLALLTSALDNEECYITTTNLDGETNLKIKSCPRITSRVRVEDLALLDGHVECDTPNADLYTFNGRIVLQNADLLLRDSPGPIHVREPVGDEDTHSSSLLAVAVDRLGLGSPGMQFSLGDVKSWDGGAQAGLNGGAAAAQEPETRARTYTMGLHELGSLDTRNLLLKGARLKNTPYVMGLALYTGPDTKIMLNQQKAPFKFSCVERRMNYYLVIFFVALVAMSLTSALMQYVWTDYEKDFWPIAADPLPDSTGARVVLVLKTFTSFVLLYNYVIPISLYITLEMQKFTGALIIGWDEKMADPDTNEAAQARTSDLIEELGQIEHLFVDKTGTLTENHMVFRRFSVRGQRYAIDSDSRMLMETPRGAQPVKVDTKSRSAPEAALAEFFMCLALCHSVWVDEEAYADANGRMRHRTRYVSMSPDEEALVRAAADPQVDMVLRTRSTSFLDLAVAGALQRFKIIHNLEFDSVRMRSSVLVALPDGRVMLYCKGADTTVLPRCTEWMGPEEPATDVLRRQAAADLEFFCEKGLRTLIVAFRELSQEEVLEVRSMLQTATTALADRAKKLSEVYDRLEQNLNFLGITAVEDRLQSGVPQAMRRLREAGMLVWVLTGDRMETAINVSMSAGHFHPQTIQLFATGMREEEPCRAALEDHLAFLNRQRLVPEAERRVRGGMHYGAIADSPSHKAGVVWPTGSDGSRGHVVILDGVTVGTALRHMPDLLRSVCKACTAVLCCRLSPMQKALVVRMVKTTPHPGPFAFVHNAPVTLAIGDGANDVAMIREAHVGVGLMGKEGRQAARSSDYAFTRFECLTRLLLVHGHLSYHRIADSVQYFFYKNVAFVVPVLLFGSSSLFSFQPIYDSWLMMLYNIVFTSWPVLTFGVLDQDLSDENLMDHPRIYASLQRNRILSFRQFCQWMVTGLYQGLVVYYGVIILCGEILEAEDLWTYATMMYTMNLTIVSLRLALHMRYWTWFSHFVVWGSLVVYAAWLLFYCGIQDVFGPENTTGGMYWVYYRMMGLPLFWALFLAIVMVALLPEFIFRFFMRVFHPTAIQQVQHALWARPRTAVFCASLRKGDDGQNETVDELRPLLSKRGETA